MAEPIVALDSEKVSRLTGIPRNTLTNWERQGVFRPSYVDPNPRSPFRRIYSFRDVVSLRALATIRRELRVPLAEIRRAGEYLTKFSESPWSELRFGVIDRRLVFRSPDTNQWVGVDGQGVLELDMEGIPQEIQRGLPEALARDKTTQGVVTRNRYVHHNKPIIAGTRIPTATIWRFHEHGYSPKSIIEEYPHLSLPDIEAALEYERNQRIVA